MADESMEIATDLGNEQGVADDYLDLDLDLTTGQLDDDSMLDDAAPTQELGDEHMLSPYQPSHPVGGDHIMQSPHHTGGDDLMLDNEDNVDEMYDEDLLEEEHQQVEVHMEDEAPSQSFVTVNETYKDYSEHPDASAIAGGDTDELTDFNWGHDETLEVKYAETNALADESFQDAEVDGFNGRQDDSEQHAKTPSNHGSHPASPGQASQDHLAVEESGSPSASNIEYPAVSRHGSLELSNQDQTQNEESYEYAAEITTYGDNTDSRAYEDITIVYRDVEYSLFGTASDDPDTYFLSDLSLAEKPIAEFLRELRNVLSFELLEQEELCLSIKHLGLDIEEISCPLHDVTISQILDLHQSLLINDEVMLYPLSMQLRVRVSFAKRFAYLVTAAADGKSLSELDAIDKNSQQYNNSGDASEVPNDRDAVVAEEIAEDEFGLHTASPNEHAAEEAEIHYTIEQTDDRQNEEHVGEDELDYEDIEDGVDDSIPADHAREATGEVVAGLQEPSQTSHSENVGEDGDLIDYSDDELDITPPKNSIVPPKASTPGVSKVCALHDNCDGAKCTTMPVEEEGANREDLRRRSLSHSTEHHLNGAMADTFQEVYHEDMPNADETENNADDWDGAEEETYEYAENSGAVDYGDVDNLDEFDVSGVLDQGEHEPVDVASTGPDDILEVEDIFADNQQYPVQEVEEYEVDLTPPSEVPEINPSENITGVSLINGGKHTPDVEASSSVTVGVDANRQDELTDDEFNLEPSNGDDKVAVEQLGDEIDYDDDDYAEGLTPPSKEEHPNSMVASIGSSGKRSREDLDDVSSELINDAKRIRS